MRSTVKYNKDQVQAILLLAWAEYYKRTTGVEETTELTVVNKPATTDVTVVKELAAEKLEELKQMGLGQSKNAECLYSIIHDIDLDNSNQKVINEASIFLNGFRKLFPNAIIIPYEEFFFILKKLNLACGPVSAYKGVIPEENIMEMKHATDIIIDNNLSGWFNVRCDHIRKIEIPYENRNKVKDVAMFPYASQYVNEKIFSCGATSGNFYTLNETDWVLAAPVAEIKENVIITVEAAPSLAEKKLAEDPLACKFTKYGMAIFSAWGEEAKLDIFDKYK